MVECVVVLGGKTCAVPLLKAQVKENPNLKFVHSLAAGIDSFLKDNDEFRYAENIKLTNAKGAFSISLAEFVATGMMFHAKKVRLFEKQKDDKNYEQHSIELVHGKNMVLVGYGNIGSHIAKMAKHGFGIKCIGVTPTPELLSEEQKSYCEEIVSSDQYDRVIAKADYVIGTLPSIPSTQKFFNGPSTFSKMKKTAIFMNMGRGTTCYEPDLAEALNNKTIAGACLDVFTVEPLPKESPLWTAPNFLLYPH